MWRVWFEHAVRLVLVRCFHYILLGQFAVRVVLLLEARLSTGAAQHGDVDTVPTAATFRQESAKGCRHGSEIAGRVTEAKCSGSRVGGEEECRAKDKPKCVRGQAAARASGRRGRSR